MLLEKPNGKERCFTVNLAGTGCVSPIKAIQLKVRGSKMTLSWSIQGGLFTKRSKGARWGLGTTNVMKMYNLG
jgi:hypothetical protein